MFPFSASFRMRGLNKPLLKESYKTRVIVLFASKTAKKFYDLMIRRNYQFTSFRDCLKYYKATTHNFGIF